MNQDRTDPAMILESLGGFSEKHFLGLFRAVDPAEVAGLLRGLNATEIAFEGSSALALGAILAPLDTGTFPRVSLEQVADNVYAIGDLAEVPGESEVAPLTLAYCASVSLYANIASKGTELCAVENAAKALLSASIKLGTLWDAELLKFCLWCSTLRPPSTMDTEFPRAVCLAVSFLLLCDLLGATASQLVHQVSAGASAGLGSSLVEQTLHEPFVRLLKREFELAVGVNGRVPVAIQRTVAATLGSD